MGGTSVFTTEKKVMCGGREGVLAAEQGQSRREEGPSLLLPGVTSTY